MVEAIVHYNQGAKKKTLPKKNELIKIAGIVFVFSVINTQLIK